MQELWNKDVIALQQRLRRAGVYSVLIGGAVRDALMGRVPTDYDMAAAASPEQLRSLLPDALPTGDTTQGERGFNYGTLTLRCGEVSCEITPFRTEGAYGDARHPDAVTFGVTLEQDLARRDFTVNAIAWDGEKLIDPYGVQADLAARTLCTVGEAKRRFREDGLRMLRAVRFASVLNFRLQQDIVPAIAACRRQLRGVSMPRLRGELQAALLGQNPAALAALLAPDALRFIGLRPPRTWEEDYDTRVLAAEVEPADFDTDSIARLLQPLSAVPCRMLPRWWALLTLLEADKKYVCSTLGFSKDFYRDMVLMDAFYTAPIGKTALKHRAAGTDGRMPLSMSVILQCFTALDDRFAADLADWQQVEAANEPYTFSALAITGSELLRLGFRGEQLGKVLRLLLDAVIAAPELNRPETLLSLAGAARQGNLL